MKKYILFGSGNLGREALAQIGSENVECFCDNNKEIVGTKKFEKIIISFEKLKEVFNDYIIVICASLEKSYIIANQLEDSNIFDYIPYVMFCYSEMDNNYWSILASDNIKRLDIKCQFYRDKSNDLDVQINYFKRHFDITTAKPAMGRLRKHQLDEINAVKEFSEIFKMLNVRPFLGGGNLIGYVRHNGFIPWDDDMDLYLIRNEFEQLKKYCLDNFKIMCSESRDTNIEERNRFFIENPEKWCVLEYYTHFQIAKMNIENNITFIDFFVMDYYSNDYEYIEHRKYLNDLYKKIIQLKYDSERVQLVKKELMSNKNIVNDSDNLYFGIDNMVSYILYDKGEWINKDVVFPLHEAEYEGIQVWVPNKPEAFLEYQYDNIYAFPNDIGLQRHLRYEEN